MNELIAMAYMNHNQYCKKFKFGPEIFSSFFPSSFSMLFSIFQKLNCFLTFHYFLTTCLKLFAVCFKTFSQKICVQWICINLDVVLIMFPGIDFRVNCVAVNIYFSNNETNLSSIIAYRFISNRSFYCCFYECANYGQK